MAKKRPHDDRSNRRTRDDERHAQKLSQLQARLLRLLRKGVRGIKRMDQITHDNVHLIHDRMEVIREQIQELMSHHGDDGILEFKGVDLHKANLIGAYFYRMDLEGANLEGSFGGNFGHVNLQQANLRNSRITDLGYANLTGAHLENADLHECCLLGARLDGANLSGANLCGAELLHIQAVGAVWDGARFDAKTRFSPDFDLPAELVWTGPGTDPRTKTSSRTRAAAKRKTPKKKAKTASKPVARRKRVAASADLSLKCLLTDRQLTKLCSGLVQDAALPDGINVEDMDHPIYGPDLQFSIALEYCPNRFRDLDLTAEEFDFNVWYRAERFARLFDAAEDGYCDGNHDRAERLMPDVSGELFGKAYRRIQREVRNIVSNHTTPPGNADEADPRRLTLVPQPLTLMNFDHLQQHYATGIEAARLGGGAGLIERDRTQAIISRYLSDSSMVVYDVGGGPGTHAIWLLGLGHSVHLVDAVPLHVEEAARGMADVASTGWSATVGDARKLDFPDRSADAVLLLGPLYHLTERADRLAALREARRVLRPGGVVFAAAISRFASLLDGLARDLLDDPDFRPIVERDLSDGQHRNPTGHPSYFTTAFFHHPDELQSEVREAGFALDRLCGIEGPTWMLPDLNRRWSDESRRRLWMQLLERVECEASLLGASSHLLAVGRRNEKGEISGCVS